MIHRTDLVSHLNQYLNIDQFQDYCVNGLQIEGKPYINKVVLGVSISQRFISAAINAQADMLIVHHGLFWKSTPHPLSLAGLLLKRLKPIILNEINLVSYHLPLDAHPVIGNNAQILEKLSLEIVEPLDVGFIGSFSKPIPVEDFKRKLEMILPQPPHHLAYGRDTIQTVGVISGGASRELEHFAQKNIDVFLTGDVQEQSVRTAEELEIHYFIAGHYNTERFGPLALMDYISEKFDVDAQFIDIENPF